MLAMPAVFILVGLVMAVDTGLFLSHAERAEATVVSVERIRGTNGKGGTSVTYLPTLAYADAAGTQHQAVTHIASSGYDYAPGETVPVYYDPEAPEDEVRIAGLFSLWGLPAVFVAVGALFIAIVRFIRNRVAPRAAPAATTPGAVRRG